MSALDARQIPYVDEFDVIGAFDVLEHIEEDELARAAMLRALRPGGGVPITPGYGARRMRAPAMYGATKLVNCVFEIVMNLERYLIRNGLRFKLGGSRLLIATKER